MLGKTDFSGESHKNGFRDNSGLLMGKKYAMLWVVRRLPIVILLTVCMSACSLSQRLERASVRLEAQYDEMKEWDALPERVITWDQAVMMIAENNLELKECDDQIASAERQGLSVYTNMIPGASYYGYMSRTISQLSKPMNSDELQSSVNVTFYLPTLTRVPYDVYAADVRIFAAKKAKEGRMRELVSKLYQQVRQSEIEVKRRKLIAAAEAEGTEPDKLQQLTREQAQQRNWQEMARLLGDRSARWRVLPESMPHVTWEDYDPLLDYLSELVVCQFVMRLEQARLAQYGVALDYLPTINTNLYSPSLFSSSGGLYSGTFLNNDDTYINMSISYRLDTQLSSWDTYQMSKARFEREKQRVGDEMMDHRNKVQLLRKSVKTYGEWRSYMAKRIAFVEETPANNAEEFFERKQLLHNMRMELLNQESSAVEHEAQAVLEYGMPDEARRTLKAQLESGKSKSAPSPEAGRSGV